MNDYLGQRRTGSPLRSYLWIAFGSFLVGALLIGYLAWRANPDLFFVAGSEPEREQSAAEDTDPEQLAAKATPEPSPTPSASATAASETVERVAEQQGGIEQRLTAAEQRLARLDLQSEAAAGNAARAEGLLIAFATRRSIERGAELGYLADQLRLRFGDALPNAVNTVISFSREPVTLGDLVARLDGLAPELKDDSQQPFFDRLGREVSGLFVIRRESTPSPQPARRMERARFFLESRRVDKAIEEVRNMPGAPNAGRWIRDAERYASAHRALDLIETSAVLEPRRLRDGTGSRIEQPSPAGEGGSI